MPVAQPATRLRAGVLEHRLVGALGEARRVVDGVDGDRERLRGADVSTPPLAVPPLSCSCTVTVALPLALAAGV